MKALIPGLFITALIAFCAKLLTIYIPFIHEAQIGAISLAIVLGIVVGNVFKLGDRFSPGVQYSEKKLLTYAIVLMGFKLELVELSKMGATVFMVVIPTMAVTIGAALLFGRLLGFSRSFGILMGAGNAVCGSSAIAAVAPATGADEEEIGVSIGVVNLLGTIGMFLLPLLAAMLHFSDMRSSYLTGGVLQAIGQVVGAGFSINDNVGNAATLIKMLRVLMIGPVVMLVSFFNRSQTENSEKKKYVPGYIIGFFACSIVGSIFHDNVTIIPHFRSLAKIFLMVAMAGVGMKIRFSSLINHGPKALLLGGLTAAVQTAFVLGIILLFMK